MAAGSSMSVLVECVKLCNLHKGDSGGSAKRECSVLSCAWKAPRALTGSLASTAFSQVYSQGDRAGRRRRVNQGNLSSSRHVGFSSLKDAEKSNVGFFFRRRWEIHCSSTSPEAFAEISPETLWEDLASVVSYLPQKELELVKSALKLAFIAHSGQKRRSGEPFIIHPVEVAKILGELELDWESIAAGLLHDTVEDTHVVTFERIEKEFGASVRHIVEGETKVSKLGKLKCNNDESTIQDVKADDLRQMFLAMTEEVRVIIVKLADRLHNMRTLSHMPQSKQCRIAMETLHVFAPLAKLLGMYQIKLELENLSFMYAHIHEFALLNEKLKSLYKEHETDLVEAKKILLQKMEDDQFLRLLAVKIELRSECREPYSVYKAMRKSKCSINDVNQIAQPHIVIQLNQIVGAGPLPNAQQICYHVLGLVHNIWRPIPLAMKDFIATPKPNGYQSLHTTVIPFLDKSTFRLEVQIRTKEMDIIAQRGIAAHYNGRGMISDFAGNLTPVRKFRGKSACLNNADTALRIGWLNAIREWQEEFVGNMTSREFVNTIMRDLLGSRVFVFTPKGEIKYLPKGATAIDYAYLIHTEIGNKMVAAKVNGNIMSPVHVLENAEVVEIVTKNQLSSKTAFESHQQWLKHAKTRSARHKIMKFLKEQAAISATEITADAVNDFAGDLDAEDNTEALPQPSYDKRSVQKKLLMNMDELSSPANSNEDLLSVHSSKNIPKINGKYNRNMQNMNLKINGSATATVRSIAQLMPANIPTYEEVLPGLESWKTCTIASWHNLRGHSIQWLCVVCVDRKGMMAEVSCALTAAGLMMCSCVAEIDRRGMGIMLFQIEGSFDSLVNVCSSVDAILGVLNWSAGCSWSNPAEACNYLEC